jgi:hypothetical protein
MWVIGNYTTKQAAANEGQRLAGLMIKPQTLKGVTRGRKEKEYLTAKTRRAPRK